MIPKSTGRNQLRFRYELSVLMNGKILPSGWDWRRHAPVPGRVFLLSFFVFLLRGWGAVDDVRLSETFSGDASLSARGWKIEADPTQSQWRIQDGHLEVMCHRNPYHGGKIVRPVPKLARCELAFDAKFAVRGAGNYNHLSLGFRLYGYMTSFKHYVGHHWLAYRPAEKRHYSASNAIPLDQWVHLRIRFDFPAHRAEFYVGGGDDPVWVDTAVGVNLEQAKPELNFFNYGLCAGTVTHLVDNIVLRELPARSGDNPTARNRALVFQGISFDRYGVAEALAPRFGKEHLSVYTLETRGAAIAPRNQFALRCVPAAERWRETALVALVDIPAGPGGCLPAYMVDDLAAAVRSGAHLLVLGGMYSYGKGVYEDTPLASLLPVPCDDPWAVRRFSAPVPMQSETFPSLAARGSPATLPGVLWYHEGARRNAAVEVLMEAGGKPMLVRRAVGKGMVTAFLGTPCGDFGKIDSGVVPFWEWPGWPDLVRQMADAALPRVGE